MGRTPSSANRLLKADGHINKVAYSNKVPRGLVRRVPGTDERRGAWCGAGRDADRDGERDGEREREREREEELCRCCRRARLWLRDAEQQTDRRQREKQTESLRGRGRETERDSKRERERETERDSERERERDRRRYRPGLDVGRAGTTGEARRAAEGRVPDGEAARTDAHVGVPAR
eukprot:2687535-Rhodomonas_salina.3